MIVFEAYRTDKEPKQSKVEYDKETDYFFIRKNSKSRYAKSSDYEFRSTDINRVWNWLKSKRELKIKNLKYTISYTAEYLEKEELALEEFIKTMPKEIK